MSTFSSFDRACLVAKYNSQYVKQGIDPKIFEDRTEAEIKYLRKTMGSSTFKSCGMMFTKEYKEFPDYNHYNFVMTVAYVFNKTGALPFQGNVAEQPAQIMEIIETINCLDMEREEDARRQAKRKKNQNG